MSAALVAMPDFVTPKILAGPWMVVKWIAVDAADYVTVSGTIQYRVGLYTHEVHRVFDCAVWVTTQEIAEMYRVWVIVKYSANRSLSHVTMLQDNMQAVWGTVNLRARTHHWKQQRILRAIVHWLRTSQLIVHVVWVPSHLQPADPLSRVSDINRQQIQAATGHARDIWSKLICCVDQVKSFGTTFVPNGTVC